VGVKADSALNKEKWSEAAKLFNEAIMDLPVDFDGGVGSENQKVRAGNLKALFWLNHAYCLDKMGQHEKAVSEWQWVVDNSASARAEDVARARTNITVTQQEIYEAQMERKRQEALKLHNSDFHPH
jgi:tetratricopeptide (TPR) repeat protein